ncbi:MAG: HYR domain-containing protein [Planctomycetota bacterium]
MSFASRLLPLTLLGLALGTSAWAQECVPRRLVDGLPRTEFAPGLTTTSFTPPATAGAWFLTVERGAAAPVRVELDGQAVVRVQDWSPNIRVLRVPVTVATPSALRVRVLGSAPAAVQVQGVVDEADLTPIVGQRVAEREVFAQRFLGGVPPTLDTASVAVPEPGLYTLQAQNGNPDGSGRVLLARPRWNQERVLGLLHLNTASASGAVLPLPQNALEVFALGPAGSFVDLSLRGWVVDELAPSASWTSPPAGSTVSAGTALELVYADGNSGVLTDEITILLNGQDVTALFTVGENAATATAGALPLASGSNTLVATVLDRACNQTQASVTFQFGSGDVTPPVLTQPADLVVEQASPQGSVVAYVDPTATDDTDPNPVVSCAPPSGSLFPPGTTTVTCTATDASGNQSSVTFTVTVQDTTAPTLTQPADLLVEQAGPLGTVVAYADPTASDAADPAPVVSCTPPSGSLFPPGATTVTCTATDASGNQSSVTFTVTVEDTTAPTLTVSPPDGSTVSTSQVPLQASYADGGSGVDLASFQATLDGQDVSGSFSVGPSSAQALSPALLDGAHTLVITVSDLAGNPTAVSSTFTVDTGADAPFALELSLSPAAPSAVPALTANDLTLRAVTAGGQTATGFSGFVLFSASDGLEPLDGLVVELTPADQGQLTIPGVAFFQTLGTVVVTAASLEEAPNDPSGSLPVTVVLPEPVIFPTPPATTGADRAVLIQGLSYPGQPVELVLNGQVVATTNAGVSGDFAFSRVVAPGTSTLFVQATNPSTSTLTPSQTVTVTAPPPAPVALSVQPPALSLNLDQVATLVVTESFADGSTADVTALAAYSSSNPALVNVIGPGEVVALAPGQATLTVSYDGLSVDVPVSVGIAALIQSSPAAGEAEVAVTRETILRFSAPLDTASVTSSSVFASFAGQPLAARQHLSPDRKTLTLFYDPPLPASSRVRVTVDGDQLLAQGAQIDADRDGFAGGVAQIDFDTLSLSVVDGTAVCGRVFASEILSVSGGGSVNVPLEGVRITVDGQEDTLFAITDANGNFRLEPAPAGKFFVHIDGRTATTGVPPGAYYPFVGKPYVGVAEEETNVGEIFLPLVTPGTLQPVSATEDTVLTFPPGVVSQYPELQGLELTVAADSLYANDGTRGGSVGVAPVSPERLPGPLPPGLDFSIVITVQTDGPTNFDVPAAVRFPNLAGLPPGSKTALWSFNHDVGAWEVVGSMTVTADGLWVVTDPGVGILAPGWHSIQSGGTFSGGPVEDYTSPPGLPPCFYPFTTCPITSGSEVGHNDGSADGTCTDPAGGSVVLSTGEERLDRVDLAIPGRAGLDFVMRRRYRSRVFLDGPLGHSWDFDYNQRLFADGEDVVRVNGRSRVDSWERLPDGSYRSPRGNFGTLIQEVDGSFVLRMPDGMKKYYQTNGLLYCLQDRHGNQLQFQYDARDNLALVIDTYGREIEFVFETFADGRDRLVRIRDFAGREVEYRYDTNYDLVEVRSPVVIGTTTGNDFPQGRVERYAYASGQSHPSLDHNLVAITRPEEVARGGPPWKTFVYGTDPQDLVRFDKVLAFTEGGVNASGVAAGGTTTIDYEELNQGVSPGDLDLPRGKATVTRRNGNVRELFVNERLDHIITRQLTRGLRAGEPAFYETRSYFTSDSQLLRRVFPQGNELRLAYGSGTRGLQDQVVEKRLIADARGGGEDLVTTFSYEPLFLRLASVTDPRGNATGYVPPLGTPSAARYTTTTTFDYQEGTDPVPEAARFGIDLSGIARGLGDLNGDGRVDQVAGNAVRVDLPTVELRPDSQQAAELGGTAQAIFSEFAWNDRGQLLRSVDAEGNVTTLAYYPEDDPDGDGRTTLSKFELLGTGETGYLRQVVRDAELGTRRSYMGPLAGLTTQFRYDEVGNLVATINPRGVETQLEVTALNEVVRVVRGARVDEAVARGQLITGESPFGYQVRTWFDHNGRAVRVERENRDSTTAGVGAFVETITEYDILNNPVAVSRELDATTVLSWAYRYDPDELLQEVVQPEGNRTFTEYDERNLVIQATRGFGDVQASTVRVDYDLNGNRVRVTDAQDNDGNGLGEETVFAFDGFDRLVQVTDALGNVAATDYDVAGNVVERRVDGHPANLPAAANVTLKRVFFSHDELGRVYQVDEALFVAGAVAPVRPVVLSDGNSDGFVTAQFEFDRLGRLTHTVEDDGEVTRSVFDGVSRVVESVDALGNRMLTSYDQNSNALAVTSVERSPEGLVPDEVFTTRYVWDQLDRLVRATDNAGQTTRFAYDSRDNLVFRSDPEGAVVADPLGVFPGNVNAPGNTCTWFYDGLDRQVRQLCDLRVGGTGAGGLDTSNPTNPDGQVSLSYVFDGNSRLTGIVDDNLNRTSFGWDALDRKTSQTNADGESYVYGYDRDHNLVSVVDPNGSVCAKTYDVLNRLVQVDVARAAGVVGTTQEVFGYDGLSRMTSAVDDNGAAPDQTCAWVFDSLSRVAEEQQNGTPVSSRYAGDGKRLACVYPGGRVVSQTFDAIDRVKSVSDAGGVIATSDWIGPGYRELRRVNGNGTTFSFVQGGVDTGYDAVKRIVRLRHLTAGGVAFVDREYGYNRASQRTFERRNDDFGQTDSYVYDSMYRVVDSLYDQGGSGGTTRDVAQQSYRLDGVGNRRVVEQQTASVGVVSVAHSVNEVNEYTAIGAVARAHSDNGNLVDDGTRLFSFDYKNRLVGVTEKSTGTPIATYVYYSDNRRAQKTVFATGETTTFFYDGWQVCEETGASNATYVWNPVYVDELCRMDRDGGQFYAHQNARADVVAVSDATGAVVEQRFFDDYGQVFDTAKQGTTLSAVGNPYGFQGRRLDPETGLYYFRNRYYSPSEGRFIQRDPVWDAGNVGGQYSFAGSGPLSRMDPSGTDAIAAAMAEFTLAAMRMGSVPLASALTDAGMDAAVARLLANSAFIDGATLGPTAKLSEKAVESTAKFSGKAAAARGGLYGTLALAAWWLADSYIQRDIGRELAENTNRQTFLEGQLRGTGSGSGAGTWLDRFLADNGRLPNASELVNLSNMLNKGDFAGILDQIGDYCNGGPGGPGPNLPGLGAGDSYEQAVRDSEGGEEGRVEWAPGQTLQVDSITSEALTQAKHSNWANAPENRFGSENSLQFMKNWLAAQREGKISRLTTPIDPGPKRRNFLEAIAPGTDVRVWDPR